MGNQSSSPMETNPSSANQHDDSAVPSIVVSNNESPSRLDTSRIARPNKKLDGMALIQYKCRRSKAKYETCVSDWYGNEFMKGDYANQEEACGDLFETYKKCVLKGVRKEFWGKNNKRKPKEGSFLSELEDADDENNE